MSIKVGTDIVNVDRIKLSYKKFGNKFLERFLTSEEITRAKKIESIAGLWAAKEAISKAFGCGIGKELNFKDIVIKKDSKGAPYFTLNSSNFKVIDSSLSISHDKDFAIAVAVVNYI
jgi:holo-[acyl-carrier protein] synthase